MSTLRSVLPQATPENFEDLFLKELDPLMMEKRSRILAQSENSENVSPEEMESLKIGPSFVVSHGKSGHW